MFDEYLRILCETDGTSGSEKAVRDCILANLPAECEAKTDALGNLIVYKKGRKNAAHRLMLAAHMDEVGIIVTHIDDSGFLSFTTVGGIVPGVLAGRAVRFSNGTVGVIGLKPIHLLEKNEEGDIPAVDKLYVDIGADTKEEALARVMPGDTAVFHEKFLPLGQYRICSKAVDDRVGCAVLLTLLHEELPADAYFVFTVQEEIGLRGAGTAAFAVAPDYALILEGTTAADLPDTEERKKVCRLNGGAVVSFMDRATVYPSALFRRAFDTAKREGIAIQTKTMVAGGNDAGAVHKAGAGVQVLSINTPCRYIHAGSTVADRRDMQAVLELTRAMITELTADD